MKTLKELHIEIEELCSLLPQLDVAAQSVQASDSGDQPWRDSLVAKLRVQTAEDSPLIVAVAGGTNIGKSTIFNNLAQSNASGVSPMASGTKYPVCLVPHSWADDKKLKTLFDGFDVQPWTDSTAPLENHATDVLYWREDVHVPPQLILLDTPDVDSTNPANWRRAEKVRQIADVLIAVLTQQKYNDEACAKFFCQAAQSGKEFIVIFNQVDKEYIEEYLPLWLTQFEEHVGQSPILVYVAIQDRQAAMALRLPFYQIELAKTESGELQLQSMTEGASLQKELASLHFDELKMTSLRKALADAINSQNGLGAWIVDICNQSKVYEKRISIIKDLSPQFMEEDFMPTEAMTKLLNKMLIEQTTLWIRSHRAVWIQRLCWPYEVGAPKLFNQIKKGWKILTKQKEEEQSPEEEFLTEERGKLIKVTGKILREFRTLAETDERVGSELKKLFVARPVKQILEDVGQRHKNLPVFSDTFKEYIHNELTKITQDHPKTTFTLQTLESALSVVRPCITLALGAFMFGAPATVSITAAALGGGIFDPATIMARFFKNIQERFYTERLEWLRDIIQKELQLDTFFENIRRQAEVQHSPEIQRAKELIEKLKMEN